MVYVRELAEEACQKLDLYQTTATGYDLDKLTFEEYIKSQGKGDSAFASARVWTRAMLGRIDRCREPT
jgi:monoamine oxidase